MEKNNGAVEALKNYDKAINKLFYDKSTNKRKKYIKKVEKYAKRKLTPKNGFYDYSLEIKYHPIDRLVDFY